MIELYSHQQSLLDSCRASMRRGNKSVLIQAATGFGKTILSAKMIHDSRTKGTRSMMVVPRRELLSQTSETFNEYEMPFGYVAAGKPHNPYARTKLATTGTLSSWIRRTPDKAPDVDVLIVDETHYGGDGLDDIIQFYKKRGSYLVGLSATPWKLDGRGLGMWYDDMVCGPSIRWLMDNKFLSDYRLFAPNKPDLSKIKTVAGDYAKGQLADYMEHDRVLVGNAVQHYRDHAMGRLNIAYTTSRKHSEIVAQSFRDAGIPAMDIDGETPEEERRKIIRAFARRELLVLVNCELLTFGFDLASAAGIDVTVESMSDLRPTKSLSLQMQKWGRVLRRKDYPALIFDHAGNVSYHGFPDDDRKWSLVGEERGTRGSASERITQVKVCDRCAFAHAPSPSCPSCGFVYPVRSREIDEVDGTLTEMSRAEVPHPEKIQAAMDAMIFNAVKKGMPKWKAQQWAAKQITKQLARRQ